MFVYALYNDALQRVVSSQELADYFVNKIHKYKSYITWEVDSLLPEEERLLQEGPYAKCQKECKECKILTCHECLDVVTKEEYYFNLRKIRR